MASLSRATGHGPRLTTRNKFALTYVALAAADTWLSGKDSRRAHRLRRITKPLLMPTLAARVVTGPATPLRTSTLAAQAGGWGGDVALLSDRGGAFMRGMALFGLGHAAYVWGFRRVRAETPLRDSSAARAATAAGLATGPMMAIAASRTSAALGPATLGYSASLSAMAAHAGNLGPAVTPAARRWTAAGALLFLASDTMLGARKFMMSDPPPALERAVMASYTAAQFCLAEGASRA